jgi:alpha-tubulin suppressor-like RCC1 family protein
MTTLAPPRLATVLLRLAVMFAACVLPVTAWAATCGTVTEWGKDTSNFINIPAGLDNVKDATHANYHGLALKYDGTLVGWAITPSDGVVTGAVDKTNVASITVGTFVAAAVKFDGTVQVWGSCLINISKGKYINICAVPPGLSGVVQMAIVGDHMAALKSDGSIVAWGNDASGIVTKMNGKTGVQSITGRAGYAMVKTDGSVEVVTETPLFDPPPPGLKATKAWVSGAYVVALTPAGKTEVWGYPNSGLPIAMMKSDVDHIVSLAAGSDYILALRDDGTVAGWGPDFYKVVPDAVKLTGVTAIAGDQGFAIGVAVTCANGCGSVSPLGCCNGDTLKSCDGGSGALVSKACAAGTCGWNATTGTYGCDTTGGTSPAGEWPKICPAFACKPDCTGKTCGGDGCGGSCGTCGAGQLCLPNGTCWSDKCNGNNQPCEDCIKANVPACNANWNKSCQNECANPACAVLCGGTCTPNCTGKTCGPDGCGGQCGVCPGGKLCSAGQCAPDPKCGGANGPCGDCICKFDPYCCQVSWDALCETECTQCSSCTTTCKPDCTGKTCGADGCGGSCGACAGGSVCSGNGQCASVCKPSCLGKVCGDDGCGGSCGQCGPGKSCDATGKCVAPCTSDCTGKACGGDGCGGQCGLCTGGATCNAKGQCVFVCTPKCTGKTCGDDGCGGSCGTCKSGETCNGSGECSIDASPCGSVQAVGSTNPNKFKIPADLKTVKAVVASIWTGLALKYDGTVIGWGLDDLLIDGAKTRKDVAVLAVGHHHAVIAGKNGMVEAWGANKFGQTKVPAGLSGVVAVAAGEFHTVALTTAGKVVAWGRDDGGDVSQVSGLSGVTAIAAGGQHTAVIKKDGSVEVFGKSAAMKAVPAGLKATQVAVGKDHVLARKPDGTVAAWGGDFAGQIAVPADLKDVVTVAAGEYFSLALKTDGLVAAWGNPYNFPVATVGYWKGVTAISAAVGDSFGFVVTCNEACGAVSPTGCCSGAALKVCGGAGVLVEKSCASGSCGWNAATGTFGCNTTGKVAPGLSYAKACGGACTPDCTGKTCGDDGCGGVCGACKTNEVCTGAGQCQCVPACQGKACGDDGCGATCGKCGTGTQCKGDQCVCAPQCSGKTCGPDSCGGECGKCGTDQFCTIHGTCQDKCKPACTGKTCGPDGCGGDCGTCGAGTACNAKGVCQGVPKCDGKTCGADGCGGVCGSCATGQTCNPLTSSCCVTQCSGKTCGNDGCGGVCGACQAGWVCTADGKCKDPNACVATCTNKECGTDGCKGSCGTCKSGDTCTVGLCVSNKCPNTPPAGTCKGEVLTLCTATGPTKKDCGKQGLWCGWDATAGKYGCMDKPGLVDPTGKYSRQPPGTPACLPDCAGKTCGSDGCGGSCGTCGNGQTCNFGLGKCGSNACTDIPAVNCCQGNIVIRCAFGSQNKVDCGKFGKPLTCGWDDDKYFCSDKATEAPASVGSLRACPEGLCQPSCNGAECGEDGCGGTCGSCAAGDVCKNGMCGPPCVPDLKSCSYTWTEKDPKTKKDTTKSNHFCKAKNSSYSLATDNCGNECQCPQGMKCQKQYSGPIDLCVPVPENKCGDVQDPCCDGQTIKWCDVSDDGKSMIVKAQDCQASGHYCGWQFGSDYTCGSSGGADPGGKPKFCKGATQTCKPSCDGKTCGEDGCGGKCACAAGGICDDDSGKCISTEGCGGVPLRGCCQGDTLRLCQKNTPKAKANVSTQVCTSGCGWNAGTGSYACSGTGKDPGGTPIDCPCIPDCKSKKCGDDGCGGSCGACSASDKCTAQGKCCKPYCPSFVGCGDDGCGGNCQACPSGQECVGTKCLLVPPKPTCENTPWQGACNGETLQYCTNGKVLTQDCTSEASCGWNPGIGAYSCGTKGGADPSGKYPKTAFGTTPKCVPQCSGKQCGADGCGGQCGTCVGGAVCGDKGICVPDPTVVKWSAPIEGCCVTGNPAARRNYQGSQGLQQTSCTTAAPDCGRDSVTYEINCGKLGKTVYPPLPEQICQDCGTCVGKKPCETNKCGQLCGGCKPSLGQVCNYGNGLCEKAMSGGSQGSCDGLCGQAPNAIWPCQCDTGCEKRGDCCGNYAAWCQSAKPKPNACGDKKCDATLGETCSTCATDCGACKVPGSFLPPWPSPYAQGQIAPGTAYQTLVDVVSALDQVLPSGSPYPLEGLVAFTPRPNVSAGPPTSMVLPGALKPGATLADVTGTQGAGFGFEKAGAPTFATQRILLDQVLPRRPFEGQPNRGGWTLGAWFKVPKAAPDVANPLLSLKTAADDLQTCGWSRNGDSKVKLTCPDLAPGVKPKSTIRWIRGYYGSTQGSPTPDGTCGKYSQVLPDYRCQTADAQKLVEAACVGKNECEIDLFPTTGDPCASVAGTAARLVVRAGCGYAEPGNAGTLVVEPSEAGGRLRLQAGSSSSSDGVLRTQAPIDRDVWHHVAVTYSPYPPDRGPGVRRLYLDGIAQATDTLAYQAAFNEVVLGAGPVAGVPVGSVNVAGDQLAAIAHLDDVFVYDRALSEDEIGGLIAKRQEGVLRVWPVMDQARVVASGIGMTTGKALSSSVVAPNLTGPNDPLSLAATWKALNLVGTATYAPSVADADLGPLPDFTFLGWVRTSTLTAGKPLMRLLLDKTPQATIAVGSGCKNRAVTAFTGTTQVPAAVACEHGLAENEWAFVALVQTGATQSVYVDGYRVGTQTLTAATPLFAGATGQQVRTFEAGGGVELGWATLFGRALGDAELDAWRGQGPQVWLDGMRYNAEGKLNLRDYANFHNNSDGAWNLDRPRLRKTDSSDFTGADGPGPLTLDDGGLAHVTVPARGRFRRLDAQGVQAFSWAGRVQLTGTTPASLSLIRLNEGDVGLANRFSATLVCPRTGNAIACRVDFAGRTLKGGWAQWSSETRGAKLTSASQTFELAVALAFDGTAPRVAFGTNGLTAQGKLVLPPVKVKVAVTPAGPDPSPGQAASATAYFSLLSPAGKSLTFSSFRLYSRALSDLELTRLCDQDCATVGCAAAGRVCSPGKAGALPVCAACDGKHVEAASDLGATCVQRLPFFAPCAVDAQCVSDFCSNQSGRCAYKTVTPECQKTCGDLGRTCIVAAANFPDTKHTTCSKTCKTYFEPPTVQPDTGQCVWTPTAEAGEVCLDDLQCKITAKCVKNTEPIYQVSVDWSPACGGGKCPTWLGVDKKPLTCDKKLDMSYLPTGKGPSSSTGGVCPAVATASSKDGQRGRCAGGAAPDCTAIHRQTKLLKGAGAGGADVAVCGECDPTQYSGKPMWVKRWRLMSPQLCKTMVHNGVANRMLGLPGIEYMGDNIESGPMAMLALDKPMNYIVKPKDVADMIAKGMGPELVDMVFDKGALAQWSQTYPFFGFADCFNKEFKKGGMLDAVQSPFFDPEVNHQVCAPNQYPDGTPCPPEGVDIKLADQFCQSGFCARDTHVCEEGYGRLDDTSAGDKKDQQDSEEGDISPVRLVQRNVTTAQVKKVDDPKAKPTDKHKRSYSIAIKNVHDLEFFGATQEIFGIQSTMFGTMDDDKTSFLGQVLLMGFALPGSVEPGVGCPGASWKNGEYTPPPGGVCGPGGTGDKSPLELVKKKIKIPAKEKCFPSPGGCKENKFQGSNIQKYNEKGPLCYTAYNFIGPVPVKMEAAVTIDACVEIGVAVDKDTQEPAYEVTPKIGVNLTVTGTAGASEGLAKLYVAVEAAITIAELAFPVKWALTVAAGVDETVTPSTTVQNLFIVKFTRTVDMVLTILKLDLTAKAVAGVGPAKITKKLTIFEFDGWEFSWNLEESDLFTKKIDFQHFTVNQ